MDACTVFWFLYYDAPVADASRFWGSAQVGLFGCCPRDAKRADAWQLIRGASRDYISFHLPTCGGSRYRR